MRGRRFYGGGSGFLLCFAAERKHCAPESLFQLPPPSHTLLREKVAVRPIFCTVWHCALRCFPPEAQWRAPGSSRQFSLTTYTFLRGGGYAWPEGLRRRVWISALLCGRKETLCARKPVPIAAPISHAFAGKGYCTHNGNRAVTAFLFPNVFVGKGGCAPGFLHCSALCTALLSARSAKPCAQKFAAVLSDNLHVFAGRGLCVAGGFTAEALDFCFALRQKGNVACPKACYNCRSHLTRFCGKRWLCARKPVPIAAPISHAFAGKGGCATGFFELFGIVHCVAFRQKRNAVRPEVRGSSL